MRKENEQEEKEEKSRIAERVAVKYFFIETVFVWNTWVNVRCRRAMERCRENAKRCGDYIRLRLKVKRWQTCNQEVKAAHC